MASVQYEIYTGAAVALAAATAKTVLFATAPAQFGIVLKKFSVSFDGVTSSAVPVVVEIMASTAASNSVAGTGNTTATINQTKGRAITTGFTGGYNCTSEPTVLTVVRRSLLSPNGGVLWYDWPLGDEPDNAVSTGFAIRCTAPAIVNVQADMTIERI